MQAPDDSTPARLLTKFRELYHSNALVFRAPGRVNLIGEHTDYNDGFVLPIAIGFYTWVAVAPRKDRTLLAYSSHFDEETSLSLDSLSGVPRKNWSDFVRGVAATLQTAKYDLAGTNMVIYGEIPLGAGLSSSASLELAVALALAAVAQIEVERLELVKLCQKAEYDYVGTRCGIMDQFVSAFAQAEHALLLDCRSLEYQSIAIPRDVCLVACNSMLKRELAEGEYNRRRDQCEAGVKALRGYLPNVHALRDVGIADLEAHKRALPETIYRRCRHVVSENKRVLQAANALRSHDPLQLGSLMYSSHASLRDDYEVSCEQLDLLVDLAASRQGVYGARMMGGGFGGCTINLLRSDCLAAFKADMTRMYGEKTGTTPEIYLCQPSQGAGAWPKENANLGN
jgi:galactokinase